MTATEQIYIPNVHTFEQILQQAKEKTTAKPFRAVLIEPEHANVLNACVQAREAGLISFIIVGDAERIKNTAEENKIDLHDIETIEANDKLLSIQTAVRMAAQGDADILIRGMRETNKFIRILFQHETGFAKKGKLVSHVAVMKPAQYPKLLLLSDAFVTIAPDLKQKIALINNLIQTAHVIGIEMPRIAVLAAVEVVYPQMPVTLDGAVLAKMSGRRQIKGGYVDGPLSFDCAVDFPAAQSKGIADSEVAGQADALLAPNIETAYGIYQAMALYGNAQLGGVLVNGIAPVAMSARTDSVETIFHSIVLAILMEQ